MKINSINVAQPTQLQVVISDLDNESARDPVTAQMYRDRIATKRKLNCQWGLLTSAEIAQILREISNVFFNVTYTDPLENKEVTRTFYAGDRTSAVSLVIRGETLWSGFSCNFIER